MFPIATGRSPAYLEHGLHPEPLDSQQAIEDRVCTKYGLNLYDAATWQIGLALRNEFEVQEVYLRQILFGSTTGRQDDIGGIKDIRGDTKDFKYGPSKILGTALEKVVMPGNASNPTTADGTVKTIPGAYFYRMIAPCYKCEDPLIGKYAESFQVQQDGDARQRPSVGCRRRDRVERLEAHRAPPPYS